MFWHLRMIFLHAKNLVNKHKQVGLGQTPLVWELFPLNPVFFLKASLTWQLRVTWTAFAILAMFSYSSQAPQEQYHDKQLDKLDCLIIFFNFFLILILNQSAITVFRQQSVQSIYVLESQYGQCLLIGVALRQFASNCGSDRPQDEPGSQTVTTCFTSHQLYLFPCFSPSDLYRILPHHSNKNQVHKAPSYK